MTLHRSDLKQLSMLRQKEAGLLLRENHFPGAFYLAGLSVECALKACIAKRTRAGSFPDKSLAMKVFVHDLSALLLHTGFKTNFEQDLIVDIQLNDNWLIVRSWDIDRRYDTQITETEAREMFSACTSYKHGVLPWFRKRW